MNKVKIKGILEAVGEQFTPSAKDIKNQVAGAKKSPETVKLEAERKKQTDEAIKKMYQPSDSPESSAAPEMPKSDEKELNPEEAAKLEALKQQLHTEKYYDPTFNRRPEEEEERPAEKIEREEEQKKMELMEENKKQEKKDKSIAVQMEQNKAEQYRGSSG